MNVIRADRSGYNTNLWYSRISGNILEINVYPHYHHKRAEYRSAVISAGQAIHAVSKRLEDLGCITLIQSFPNLERPELIASLRYYERSDSGGIHPVEDKNTADPAIYAPTLQLLKSEAERHELNLLSTPKNVTFKTFNPLLADPNTTNLLLVSRFDNPFYWLKTGYWRETMRSFIHHTPTSGVRLISDFINCYTGNKLDVGSIKNLYIQGVISLQNSSKKTSTAL